MTERIKITKELLRKYSDYFYRVFNDFSVKSWEFKEYGTLEAQILADQEKAEKLEEIEELTYDEFEYTIWSFKHKVKEILTEKPQIDPALKAKEDAKRKFHEKQ